MRRGFCAPAFVAVLAAVGLLCRSDGLIAQTAGDCRRLIRLPEDAPPPPAGYATLDALQLAHASGEVESLEIHGHETPASVELREGVAYGCGSGQTLKLDLYSPRGLDRPAPALIFIHGGGWKSGDRSDYQFYAMTFAEKGYVAASISYRLVKVAAFPAAVEDAKCAVRWMRANAAELHVDPNRIGVIGGSAGGYLSLMVGYTAGDKRFEGNGGHEDVSSAVQAVVDLYGPTDFDMPAGYANKTVADFLGKRAAEEPELFRLASPINYVSVHCPPTFVLHGTIDSTVPVEQSDMLVQKLEELEVPHWYDRLEGWPHTMDINRPVNERTIMLLSKFFETYLAKRGS
jgi:acetyl esterase/lipase